MFLMVESKNLNLKNWFINIKIKNKNILNKIKYICV